MNPYIEDSSKEVKEILDNEDLNHAEDISTGQNSSIEIISNKLFTGDLNVRQERFRHFIRNERRNYHNLYYKEFAKVVRAAALINRYNELYIYKKAMNGPEREQWLQIIQSEWDSLKRNKTWKLIYSLSNRFILKERWVFKKKFDIDSKMIRYKAR